MNKVSGGYHRGNIPVDLTAAFEILSRESVIVTSAASTAQRCSALNRQSQHNSHPPVDMRIVAPCRTRGSESTGERPQLHGRISASEATRNNRSVPHRG
jgi:hypothetical protein